MTWLEPRPKVQWLSIANAECKMYNDYNNNKRKRSHKCGPK